MARHEQINWNLPNKLMIWDQVNTAVLMDIRDELQKLNGVFSCHRFQSIPHELKALNKRLLVHGWRLTKCNKPQQP